MPSKRYASIVLHYGEHACPPTHHLYSLYLKCFFVLKRVAVAAQQDYVICSLKWRCDLLGVENDDNDDYDNDGDNDDDGDVDDKDRERQRQQQLVYLYLQPLSPHSFTLTPRLATLIPINPSTQPPYPRTPSISPLLLSRHAPTASPHPSYTPPLRHSPHNSTLPPLPSNVPPPP